MFIIFGKLVTLSSKILQLSLRVSLLCPDLGSYNEDVIPFLEAHSVFVAFLFESGDLMVSSETCGFCIYSLA